MGPEAFPGVPPGFLLRALLGQLQGQVQGMCLSDAQAQECQKAEMGEMRGRTLSHLMGVAHIGEQQSWLQNKIAKISKTEASVSFSAKILTANTEGKLPPFYLVGTSEKDARFVETAKMVEKEKMNCENGQAKIAAWTAYKGFYETAVENAASIAKTLNSANRVLMGGKGDKENVADVIKKVSENSLVQFKQALVGLEKLIAEDKRKIETMPRVANRSFTSGSSQVEFSAVGMNTRDFYASKLMQKISGKTDELKGCLRIFEACIAGINGALSK
jgi:hypothetical protein